VLSHAHGSRQWNIASTKRPTIGLTAYVAANNEAATATSDAAARIGVVSRRKVLGDSSRLSRDHDVHGDAT